MSDDTRSPLQPPVSDRDHVEGFETAGVTLVEYGDYECPHCAAAYPIVKALQKRLGAQLRFAFRHFPLTSIHPHAQRAAEAAEAAGAQGFFREMHDVLFEHQHALRDRDLTSYAAALGLDVGRFTRDLLEHTHASRIREDVISGARSGVNGTPTFFINGYRHDGAWDRDTLMNSLRTALRVA